MVDGSDFENTLAHHLPMHMATPKGLHLDLTTIIAEATLTCAIQVLLTSSTRCSRQCEWTASTRPRPYIVADWFPRKPSYPKRWKSMTRQNVFFTHFAEVWHGYHQRMAKILIVENSYSMVYTIYCANIFPPHDCLSLIF